MYPWFRLRLVTLGISLRSVLGPSGDGLSVVCMYVCSRFPVMLNASLGSTEHLLVWIVP